MTRRPFRALAALSLTLALTGCVAVTINVTFPQEQIDTAASDIEDLVRQPAAPKEPPPRMTPRSPAAPKPRARAGGVRWARAAVSVLAAAGPAVAEAEPAGPSVRTRTPEVMALVESRRARYAQLMPLLGRGCVGESAVGLLEPRPGTDCPSGVPALIAAENRDRTALFTTIVRQNDMPPDDITRVQAGFARRNRERAPAGAWVQDDGGAWTRKARR